jgi:hypothetical protein
MILFAVHWPTSQLLSCERSVNSRGADQAVLARLLLEDAIPILLVT